MEFFNSAIEVLQTLVVALGAGLQSRTVDHFIKKHSGFTCRKGRNYVVPCQSISAVLMTLSPLRSL